MPMLLQTETSECGLACLGMVAGYYGQHSDLNALRRQFPISLKGATLSQLMRVAGKLGMNTRPLKLSLNELPQLRLPCILHWEFNHFVVLRDIDERYAVICDPATGERKLAFADLSDSFTGIALEAWPAEGFKQQSAPPGISLRSLVGRLRGLSGAIVQALVLAVALEVCALVGPLYMQWVIDHVLPASDTALLATLGLGFGLLVLLQQALGATRSWLLLYTGTTVGLQWRSNVFAHLLRLPLDYFRKRHLGDVVSRFDSVDSIQRTLTSTFVEAILDGVMTVLTLAMMFLYNPFLPWIPIMATALYIAVRCAWYAPLRRVTEEQLVHAAKQHSNFLETVRGIGAIKAFQREQTRQGVWQSLLAAQLNADLRSQKMTLLYRAVNGVLFGLERVALIWLGTQMVLDAQFTVGALLALIAYREQFIGRAAALVDKFFELRMMRLQGERLADIVLTSPESDGNDNETVDDRHDDAPLPPPAITLRSVSFRHHDDEAPLFDAFDLHIAAGESVAIAGASGCGKSTLLQLLQGHLQPKQGEVLVDGVPLAKLGLVRLRKMTATVQQDDALFAGSIADNIAFFDQPVDMQRVKECAAMAAIDADINTMPMTYDTLIGDMGTTLSGGQKQRVLLARALYKRPRLLLLDEATSDLDLENERRVNEAIRALNITRIIVAHRPETIASADRIIVLAGGKIQADVRPDKVD